MDNLPIEPVTRILDRLPLASSTNPKWASEPWPEHLIVAASLESNIHPNLTVVEEEALRRSWRALSGRARQLGYNSKLDKYEWAERERARQLHKPGRAPSNSPAIRILPVKPEWLCSTFAAHPMLGFRRDRQKRSVAHGCASTLLRFGGPDIKSKLDCWGADSSRGTERTTWGEAFDAHAKRGRQPESDRCWLRDDLDCPFSKGQLKGLPEELVEELSEIHRLCPEPETQLRTL